MIFYEKILYLGIVVVYILCASAAVGLFLFGVNAIIKIHCQYTDRLYEVKIYF